MREGGYMQKANTNRSGQCIVQWLMYIHGEGCKSRRRVAIISLPPCRIMGASANEVVLAVSGVCVVQDESGGAAPTDWGQLGKWRTNDAMRI